MNKDELKKVLDAASAHVARMPKWKRESFRESSLMQNEEKKICPVCGADQVHETLRDCAPYMLAKYKQVNKGDGATLIEERK